MNDINFAIIVLSFEQKQRKYINKTPDAARG